MVPPGPAPRAPLAQSSRVRRGLSGCARPAGWSCRHGWPRSKARNVWPPDMNFLQPRPPPGEKPAFQAPAGLGAAPSAEVPRAAVFTPLSLALLSSPQAQSRSRVPSASGSLGWPGRGFGRQTAQVTGGPSSPTICPPSQHHSGTRPNSLTLERERTERTHEVWKDFFFFFFF